MHKGTHFIGQPETPGSKMAWQAANHRLHDHHALLQPHIQGCGPTSEDGKEEGRHQGSREHPRQRGRPSDIRFTSAATNDSFMLKPSIYTAGDLLTMDRAYIDYAKFEELTRRGVTYVTKMKKGLVYTVEGDTMYMSPQGQMEYRVQHVTFTKRQGRRGHRAPRKDYHIRRHQEYKGESRVTADQRHGDGGGGYRGGF